MRRTAILIFMAIALAACQAVKPDPAVVSKAQALYGALGAGQQAEIIAQLPPERNTAANAALIAKLHAIIPAGPPQSTKFIGVKTLDAGKRGKLTSLTEQYDYADRTALFRTQFTELAGAHDWQLQSFNLVVSTHRELERNRFGTTGKSAAQLGFLALAAASPVMMLLAFFSVLRARSLELKWLWALLCFGGLCTFEMNWATGVVLVQWSLQFIGFTLYHGPSAFTPWSITASLPIGAMIVLGRIWAVPPRVRKASA